MVIEYIRYKVAVDQCAAFQRAYANAADILHEKAGANVTIWNPGFFNKFFNFIVGWNWIIFNSYQR